MKVILNLLYPCFLSKDIVYLLLIKIYNMYANFYSKGKRETHTWMVCEFHCVIQLAVPDV